MRGRGLAAAAVMAMVLLLAACSGNDQDPPAGRIDASYVVEGEVSCESDVKDAPTLPFEDEPLSMLICADPDSLVPWTAPVDVVEQDLGRLVDAIGDLEPAPDEPFDCQFDGGVGFHLLLRLPQDRVVRVAGDTGGCSLIENAGQRWLGGDEFFLTALELV